MIGCSTLRGIKVSGFVALLAISMGNIDDAGAQVNTVINSKTAVSSKIARLSLEVQREGNLQLLDGAKALTEICSWRHELHDICSQDFPQNCSPKATV